MRIPAGLYEGFYMSVSQPTDRLGRLPAPVAKAKANSPMERRGPRPLPILRRDPRISEPTPSPRAVEWKYREFADYQRVRSF